MGQIIVSKTDALRLRAVLRAHDGTMDRDQAHHHDLEDELDRATVVEADDVPSTVITMRAAVRVEDATTGESLDCVLVFPRDADVASNRISILAPLGTALLGYSEHDELEWRMPSGVRRLRIRKVTQEASQAPATGTK